MVVSSLEKLKQLNEEFLHLREEGKAVENVVNEALFIIQQEPELLNVSLEICEEIKRVFKTESDITIVPNFISIVGSAVNNPEEAGDIDVLIRAERYVKLNADGTFKDYYLIDANNVRLPIRNLFGKERKIDFIDGPQGPHGNYITMYDLVLRKSVQKEFIPPKPQMAGYTESYNVEDLIKWADGEHIAIEPKLNGFRAILEKHGQEVKLWFEGSPNVNRIKNFKQIEEEVLSLPFENIVLDGDIGLYKNGERLARYKLNKLNAKEVEYEAGEVPSFTAFDILKLENEDLRELPFRERRQILEKVANRFKKYLQLVPSKIAETEEEIKIYSKWAINQEMSEGLVAKKLNSKYENGGTNEWFKLKKIGELKVIALRKHKKVNGYTYEVGLLGGGYKNTEQFEGKEYVNLGETHTTNINAKAGQILTVTFLEMIAHPKENTLTCMNMVVQDIDDTRKEPYTIEQGIQVANNVKLLFKDLSKYIPADTNKYYKVAFVLNTPSQIDIARQKLLSSGAGKVFKEKYLPILGLKEKDIIVVQKEQIKDIHSQAIIVGLGHSVKTNINLPYPVDDEKFLNLVKQEIVRKSKQINVFIKKQEESEEGQPFQEKWWEENWYKLIPEEGKGKFVYQFHWRGLSEEETKLSLEELMQTSHSVHGDLRLTATKDFGLWGFTVFEGSTRELRRYKYYTKLAENEIAVQGTFKINQPVQWLDVGKGKPLITSPGSVGATTQKFAKFFALDWGEYELGVVRMHAIEVFLKGDILNGRYLITYIPADGKRVWVIEKQKNETPLAEREDKEKVIQELKAKGQKYLYWRNPKEGKGELIQVSKETIKLVAKEDEKRLVYGVVLEPNTVDAQGDIVDEETIEEACHNYMRHYRVVGDRHTNIANADVVESYIAPTDFEVNGQKIKKGSWVLVVYIKDDDLWEKIKAGYYVGYSIGGFGIREF